MYSIYTAVAVCFVIALVISFRCRATAKVKLFAAGVGIAVGLFVGLIASLLFRDSAPHVNVKDATVKLASMRTSDDINGVFVWGSGSVSTTTVYRVMILNDDGSMRPFAAPADEYTLIVEDAEPGQGWMVQYREVADPNWAWRNWMTGRGSSRVWAYHFEYHVPKGTVRNTFDAR